MKSSEMINWAPVREPGFLDFQIFRFSILEIFCLQNHFGKSGGEVSRKNNKGVLERPWTKWRVSKAISGTLKFQFTMHPESYRFYYSVRQKIGDPGPIKLRTFFRTLLSCQNPLNCHVGQKIKLFMKTQFFPGSLTSA